MASIPVPDKLATEAATPVNENVGLPAVPSALETLKPAPVVAKDLATTEDAPLLTITPVPALSKEPLAPFNTICRVDCAPPSVNPTPVPPDNARLLGNVGC